MTTFRKERNVHEASVDSSGFAKFEPDVNWRYYVDDEQVSRDEYMRRARLEGLARESEGEAQGGPR